MEHFTEVDLGLTNGNLTFLFTLAPVFLILGQSIF